MGWEKEMEASCFGIEWWRGVRCGDAVPKDRVVGLCEAVTGVVCGASDALECCCTCGLGV